MHYIFLYLYANSIRAPHGISFIIQCVCVCVCVFGCALFRNKFSIFIYPKSGLQTFHSFQSFVPIIIDTQYTQIKSIVKAILIEIGWKNKNCFWNGMRRFETNTKCNLKSVRSIGCRDSGDIINYKRSIDWYPSLRVLRCHMSSAGANFCCIVSSHTLFLCGKRGEQNSLNFIAPIYICVCL